MKCLLTRAALLLVLGVWASQAQAHIMLANKGTVSIKGQNAYVVISVPVSTLNGFDDNQDKLIDTAELGRHADSLKTQVDSRIKFRADDAAPVEGVTFLLSPQTGESTDDPIDYIVAMSAQRFEKPPQTIEIWTDLFGAAEKDQRLALTASRDQTEELAVLTPERSQHRFFRGGVAVFTDFLGLGVTHILRGYDHLLFLLTILAAAMSVRQWLLIVSGFTIAHSITLTAASLGLVSVSPEIAEPLIAASIVALALDNLLGGTRRPFVLRSMIVFACGLLHGLGFAAALSEFGLSQHNIVTSLLGFNLGVEFGQIAFVSAVLGLYWVMARSSIPLTRERLLAPISMMAAVPGFAMLVVRTLPLM